MKKLTVHEWTVVFFCYTTFKGVGLMHVVIAGGSGFVGEALQERLLAAGYRVTILTRSPEKVRQSDQLKVVQWLTNECKPEAQLGQVDAIVNLAGESINGLRWTATKKKKILHSRMAATQEIIRIINALEQKPEVLVNASAVGFYGMSETETFTEENHPHADDFLASVVRRWEGEASKVEEYGVRTVYARLGIVLGKGGALPLMALPYKFRIGGTIGSGRQWLSWVHVADVAGMIQFAIENRNVFGPFNVTAPHPVRMKEFGQTVGSVLHRPHWFPVPGFLLKVMLGEMSEMLVCGQRAIPEKAKQHEYMFDYPNLKKALEDSLKP